ncbi:unnamed protein product [Bathycoccus prasinos]
MEYQFSNFIGGSYSGGDIQLRKNSLFTILSNYITIIDLEKSKCCVLPCTNASLLEKLSVNASGTLLLAVDSTGNGYLFNLNSRKCITHVQFGGPHLNMSFRFGEFPYLGSMQMGVFNFSEKSVDLVPQLEASRGVLAHGEFWYQ